MLLWACPRDLDAVKGEPVLFVLAMFEWNETDGTDHGACPRCPECGENLVVTEV